jgi:hypothetical protein
MTPTILTIPYQAFEVNHVYLTPFQMDKYGKWVAQLTYKDTSIDFNDVSLMTPPLRVIDYQPETSRLRVDLSPYLNFQIKMRMFYEYLISTFYLHQQGFLNTNDLSIEDIRYMFYSLLDENVLSIYVYPTTAIKHMNGKTSHVSDIKTGDMIRCIIRFQGVSLLNHRDGTKLRLHHSIPSIWRL